MGWPLRVTVNISSRQLQGNELVETTAEALEQSGLPADSLVLEITEGVLVEETQKTTAYLTALKALGVHLAIDDFGTGYSALSYLRRYPFSTLKIDKTFVQSLEDDPEEEVLVTTIIAMGHNLGLEIVAEGVETTGQLDFLLSQKCDLLQGFHFSRPVPADSFYELVTEGSEHIEPFRCVAAIAEAV